MNSQIRFDVNNRMQGSLIGMNTEKSKQQKKKNGGDLVPVAQRLCLFDCDCDDYTLFHIGVFSLSLCLIKYKWIFFFRPLPQSHLIDCRVDFFFPFRILILGYGLNAFV